MAGRRILHADVDAFFVSVALRDAPHLAGRPLVVAQEVIACASYEARAMGVHAGLSLRGALRRWPGLAVVALDIERIGAASDELFDLFRQWTPLVEPGSMEEAFLDVTDRAPDFDHATGLARDLRAAARTRLHLPVSVGVAPTKLYAKLASRRAKPDGLVTFAPAAVDAMRPGLRLADLWGVGPRTVERLQAAGFVTVGDLAGVDETALRRVLPTGMARRLLTIAVGNDDDAIRLPKPRGSVGATRTISPATRSRSAVSAVLAGRVAAAVDRLAGDDRSPTRIEVIVRLDDGETLLSRAPLDGPLERADLVSLALRLLAATRWEEDGRGVRLVGLSLRLPTVREPAERPTRPEQLVLDL